MHHSIVPANQPVRSYGEALAAQLAPSGVVVSVLCPGFISTPLTATNPFPMPLIMSTGTAAKKLLSGIERGSVRVAFPLRLYALTRLLEAMPASLSSWIMTRVGRNRGLKE